MSFCLIGCQKAKTEFKNVNNICELTNIIENNDEVIGKLRLKLDFNSSILDEIFNIY